MKQILAAAKKHWIEASLAAALAAALLADSAGVMPEPPAMFDQNGQPIKVQKAVFNLWVQVAIMIVSAIISYATAPKPPSPKPAALQDFDVPTAEEGLPIPVIFGTVWIRSASVLWYGDLRSQPIRTKSGKK